MELFINHSCLDVLQFEYKLELTFSAQFMCRYYEHLATYWTWCTTVWQSSVRQLWILCKLCPLAVVISDSVKSAYCFINQLFDWSKSAAKVGTSYNVLWWARQFWLLGGPQVTRFEFCFNTTISERANIFCVLGKKSIYLKARYKNRGRNISANFFILYFV